MTQGGKRKVKSRILASGVAALAIASVAVPAALSGSASAKAPSTPPKITACAPIPATIGKSVTIKGTGLAKAKSVTVGGTKVTKINHDSAKGKAIKFTVAKGTSTKPAGVTVKVTTANGTASAKCTFQAAP